jgi:hypothetical protein
MKKLLLVAMAIIFVLTSACTASTVSETASPESVTPASASPVPITAQDAIAAASADELRAMIEQYRTEGETELLYAAALRLTQLEPTDTDAYTAAAAALLAMARADVEQANTLIQQGAENADAQVIVQWAESNPVDFMIEPPFAPDYTTEGEINTEGITAGNMTNAFKQNDGWYGGLLTSQGDWVYLSLMDGDLAICKMRADGSEYQRVGDASGTCLNVVGDWLYYINNSDGSKPYKIRTDGSMKTKINDDDSLFLSVSGEWMYYSNYSDGGCLYKVKTDGSESAKLTDEMVIFPCVAGDWVYYCEKKLENGGFCRVSVDGGKPQTVVSASLRNYCVEGGWVYYNSEDTIWRVHADGSGEEVFYQCDETITAFNIAAGMLYLSAGLKVENDGYVIGNRIISIDMESMEAKQQIDFNTEPVCIGPDGWIYFMDDNEGLAWYSMNPESGEVKKIV